MEKCLKLISRFMKLMPTMFEGGPDPMVVEDWFDQVKKYLLTIGVSNNHLKIILATYNFFKDAMLWWKSVTNRHDVETMDWDTYKELFYDKYFPIIERWELQREFDLLIQGTMTVTEYENKFTFLSRFTPNLVRDEANMIQKFVFGLHYSIRPALTAQNLKVYIEAIERALMIEAEAKDRNMNRE
ncbi:uncharacterized protein LOC132286788 [Cornus florida]|uniref:uncharacterized protein LOC132286788 n=1 Tax=Cornus florida TaxID=4283 RepID=UPI00289692C5|nr:uncharacterized protein LOC132286788 [Cornus florida]